LTDGGFIRVTWRSADLDVLPCVGDLVELSTEHLPPRVTQIAPRRSVITRIDSAPNSSEHQVLAANIDVVAICEPAYPDPTLARVERMLALAWQSGGRPAVIVTKADLADDLESTIADVAALALGVPVITVTATQGQGIDEVVALTRPSETLVLLGPSGAGKSTLLNAIVGQPVMRTSHMRADGRGRHTTTHRQLIQLANGAFIIDTPGLKGVGVASADGLEQVFADIEELATDCRFNDCSHTVEPGCAVLEAISDGSLHERRLTSYRRLQREAAYQARRADARLATAERARWKAIHKEMRRSQVPRP
jgi:ribosome biogenesis GTPase